MDASLNTLVESVRSTTQSIDEAGRKKLFDTLQNLAWSIESPYDSMQRIMYSNMQLPLIRVGIDLGLFEKLVHSSKPVSTAELCALTGAATDLVSRVSRYLASVGVIVEVDKDLWSDNQLTRTICVPGWTASIRHYSDIFGSVWDQFPQYLMERNYRKLDDALDTAIGKAHGFTGLPVFSWMASQPERVKNFGQFMAIQRDSQPTCFDVYPFQQKAKGLTPEQVFFVDIGGSIGHQCVALRKLLPELPNKVILEDLQGPLSIAIQHPGIEPLLHDFWQPQVIKGARIYYLRNILHDYTDVKAVEILVNTKEALGTDPESVILIDEMVLPETNAHWYQTQLDMTMMVALSARERTEQQWRSLIRQAGLKIKQIHTYTQSLRDSIIECVPYLENDIRGKL